MITTALPSVSRPASSLPAGACDCHCHVFGPYDRFALAPDRSYNPPEASAETYLAMLDTVGMERGVLVQPSAHGLDNSAMVAALRTSSERLRGVGVVDQPTEQQLTDLRSSGVCGLRFSRLVGPGQPHYKNAVDVGQLPDLLPQLRELKMHVQLWVGVDELPALAPMIRTAGIPFTVDHMARLNPELGVAHPSFALMCELVSEGHLYVKLTPYRPSKRFPLCDDMRPFHENLIETRPDRLLWGSDWPHINMPGTLPDPGHLLDLLAEWTPDPAVLQAILVDNPATLYGF